jgi:hypothetical protein
MEAPPVAKLTLNFQVELELEYDSFKGRTAEQLAEGVQDELDDLLFEVAPNVVGVYTTLTSVESNE